MLALEVGLRYLDEFVVGPRGQQVAAWTAQLPVIGHQAMKTIGNSAKPFCSTDLMRVGGRETCSSR